MIDKSVILNVNGLDIRKNSIYVVVGKFDSSAPTGYQSYKGGVTKMPSANIAELRGCRSLDIGNGAYIWDTGFYKESPCYKDVHPDVVKSQLESLIDNVINPYEKMVGKGKLSNTNDEFWTNHLVALSLTRMYQIYLTYT